VRQKKPQQVRAFECQVIGSEVLAEGPFTATEYALTRSKARYLYYLHLKDCWEDVRFQDIKVTPVSGRGWCSMAQLAAFQRTADARGLPFARIGMKVECDGDPGFIADKNDSGNFDVVFTHGQRAGHRGNCHPRWRMKYFREDGALILDTGDCAPQTVVPEAA